jgi:hypothetical protein
MIMDKPDFQLNPAAITPETLAKMLQMPVEIVRKHIELGAPAGADGTINLVHYAAWLNTRINHGS